METKPVSLNLSYLAGRTVKAIVLYDTLYGSTERIAKALTRGISSQVGFVNCRNIRDVDPRELSEYDFIAIGAPTQAFTASRSMKEFLQKLASVDLFGRLAFAFDTKLDSRLSGSASKHIEAMLRELGLEILQPRKSAIVTGGTKQSTLRTGEEDSFEKLGEDIGRVLASKKTTMVDLP